MGVTGEGMTASGFLFRLLATTRGGLIFISSGSLKRSWSRSRRAMSTSTLGFLGVESGDGP